MRKLCFATLIGSLMVAAAHAQVYQWRDGSGRMVYGDQPPPGVNASVLRGNPSAASRAVPAATGESAAEEPAEVTSVNPPDNSTEVSRAEREAIEQRTREQEENRARACQETRNYLAGLESGQRVARFNEKGEREFLDDNARIQAIERTRATLRNNCSD
jgi:hypothetical protein